MISSTTNPTIKNLNVLKTKTKARNEQQVFIVEGLKMFEEIPPQDLKEVYVSESFLQSFGEEKLKNISYTILSDRVFNLVSDTVTPQGIMAVVKQKNFSLEEILRNNTENENKCYVILEDLRDPGNLGTILRTAEGAGVQGVILSKESVDIYSPKVIRSTMGSVFRVPFIYSDSLKDTINSLKKHGVKIYAAHLNGEEIAKNRKLESPAAFIIGNESKGISEEVIGLADKLIKIPMKGKVESLNASVSAAILMYSFLV